MSSADKPRAPHLTSGPTVAGNGCANGDTPHTATASNARTTDAAPANGTRGASGTRDAAAETARQLNPEDAQRLAERAAEALFARDKTKELLGIRVISVRPGGARVGMMVRDDMVNGHRTCHGGLIFSLADSAFAAACNSHNENNVAAAASIDFLAPGIEGDELVADASEIWRAGRTGLYEIKVTNQRGELIALFRGRSHRIGGTVTTD